MVGSGGMNPHDDIDTQDEIVIDPNQMDLPL